VLGLGLTFGCELSEFLVVVSQACNLLKSSVSLLKDDT